METQRPTEPFTASLNGVLQWTIEVTPTVDMVSKAPCAHLYDWKYGENDVYSVEDMDGRPGREQWAVSKGYAVKCSKCRRSWVDRRGFFPDWHKIA